MRQFVWAPAGQFAAQDPKLDGYVQPRSISDLVDKTQESTPTVWWIYFGVQI